MHNAGVTVVVAAGNENQNACNVSPARAADAITVGSPPAATRARRSPTTAPAWTCSRRAAASPAPGTPRRGHQHHHRHLDGVAARRGRRRAVPAGQPVGLPVRRDQRHHQHRHHRQGDQRRHRLAQPPGLLAAHRRRHPAPAPGAARLVPSTRARSAAPGTRTSSRTARTTRARLRACTGAGCSGPSGADFDLYLYKWNGSSWVIVGRGELHLQRGSRTAAPPATTSGAWNRTAAAARTPW